MVDKQLKSTENMFVLIVFIIGIISLAFPLKTLKVYAGEGAYAEGAVVSCGAEKVGLHWSSTYGKWWGRNYESDSSIKGIEFGVLNNGWAEDTEHTSRWIGWAGSASLLGPEFCNRSEKDPCSPSGVYSCDSSYSGDDCTLPCDGDSVTIQMANYFYLKTTKIENYNEYENVDLSTVGTITASQQPLYFFDREKRDKEETSYLAKTSQYYFIDSLQEVTLTAKPNDGYEFYRWRINIHTGSNYSQQQEVYEDSVALSLADINYGSDPYVYADFIKNVGTLTLSQGDQNPAGGAVTPGGKPFVAGHIQLSYDSEDPGSSINISSMKFIFYGTGNFEHIDKAILYRDETCSGERREIASAELSSDGSVTFSLSETLAPGNECYFLKYLFKYDGKFGSGFTSSESNNGACESPTFGTTISTEDIVVEGEDFEETTEITGWVTPDVYYYVEYNAKKAIDRAKIVEGSTSEILTLWNKPKICQETFTSISDKPFTIYIEDGLNIYMFSENYGNRPYIKGQGFCYGNEADKDPYLMNPVRRVFDIYKEGKEWLWTPGDEIENSYDNCCLKFAGRILLTVTNKDNITYKDFKRDILKPLQSSSYWSKKDVTVKYFRRIDSKGASVGVVWIDTRECLEKVEELLPGEPTFIRNGRHLTVNYESE